MEGNPGHTLPSFTRCINKVFAFRQAAGRLSDARHQPDISPQTVFLALFYGFLFRLASFQQVEADLAQPASATGSEPGGSSATTRSATASAALRWSRSNRCWWTSIAA